jgi:outer membrane protein TolC
MAREQRGEVQAHARAAHAHLEAKLYKGGIFPAGSLGGSGGTDKTASTGKTNGKTSFRFAGSMEVEIFFAS